MNAGRYLLKSMKHTGEVSLINEASSLVDDLRGEN